jgi:hypothetical protein
MWRVYLSEFISVVSVSLVWVYLIDKQIRKDHEK